MGTGAERGQGRPGQATVPSSAACMHRAAGHCMRSQELSKLPGRVPLSHTCMGDCMAYIRTGNVLPAVMQPSQRCMHGRAVEYNTRLSYTPDDAHTNAACMDARSSTIHACHTRHAAPKPTPHAWLGAHIHTRTPHAGMPDTPSSGAQYRVGDTPKMPLRKTCMPSGRPEAAAGIAGGRDRGEGGGERRRWRGNCRRWRWWEVEQEQERKGAGHKNSHCQTATWVKRAGGEARASRHGPHRVSGCMGPVESADAWALWSQRMHGPCGVSGCMGPVESADAWALCMGPVESANARAPRLKLSAVAACWMHSSNQALFKCTHFQAHAKA
eukprot:364695-Chlamydomonas_euryale.AAC.5